MRKVVFLVLAPLVTVLAVAVVVILWARSPQPITTSGTLTLSQVTDKTCDQVYQGVQTGMDVQVQDQTGQIVALNHLGTPTATVDTQTGIGATTCVWPFTITQIPRGRGFYVVVIGTHPAGTYSEQDMQAPLNLVIQQ